MRRMSRVMLAAGVAAVATAGAIGAGAQQQQPVQKVTPPIAVYWVSAQTSTGFGMGAMGGGGGAPDAGAIMRMMMGGGAGGANKSLVLQLGSSQTNAAPAAEHLPPQVLQMGPSLPLITPKVAKPEPREPGEIPKEYQKPRGRMLIFWGCGEHAKPGQPLVIDFAQLADGKIPQGMSALRGFDYRPMNPPSPSRNRTYGDWPNEKTRTQVPSGASLIGEHTIRGNYSPQINFTLEEDQDFLGPLNLTTNEKTPGGWGQLGWNLVGNAQAYLATAIGGGEKETVVLWTSSETQASAFAMPDYLSPSDITRLVASRALMGPATKSCTVPKEVMDAAPAAMVQLAAYGGEANFIYPPRPKDPKITWNQEWAVKVRYRSSTGGMLGMAMPGMDGGGGRGRTSQAPRMPGQPATAPAQQPPPQTPPRMPSAADIIKEGILRGGLPFPRR